jgi:hypothetical protein
MILKSGRKYGFHKPQNNINYDKYLTSTPGKTMKLTEFNLKPTLVAKKALKEHFSTNLNVDALSLYDTKRMLTKVKGIVNEMRQGDKANYREQNPAYLKAVMLEQALVHRYGELKTLPMYNQRVIVENEEVEKSQVILAAQEMVDSLQKMVEEVSDMLVKELPAVVDGVNSEVGTSEGEQFNSQVSEALTSLQAALTQSKNGLSSALGTITGQGGGFGTEPGMGDEMGGDMGMGDEMGGAEELGGEQPDEALPELPEEPDEEEPVAGVGRPTR